MGLDLLTQAALPFYHFKQLPVSLVLGLRGSAPTGRRLALRKLGQVLVLQVEMNLLLLVCCGQSAGGWRVGVTLRVKQENNRAKCKFRKRAPQATTLNTGCKV